MRKNTEAHLAIALSGSVFVTIFKAAIGSNSVNSTKEWEQKADSEIAHRSILLMHCQIKSVDLPLPWAWFHATSCVFELMQPLPFLPIIAAWISQHKMHINWVLFFTQVAPQIFAGNWWRGREGPPFFRVTACRFEPGLDLRTCETLPFPKLKAWISNNFVHKDAMMMLCYVSWCTYHAAVFSLCLFLLVHLSCLPCLILIQLRDFSRGVVCDVYSPPRPNVHFPAAWSGFQGCSCCISSFKNQG